VRPVTAPEAVPAACGRGNQSGSGAIQPCPNGYPTFVSRRRRRQARSTASPLRTTLVVLLVLLVLAACLAVAAAAIAPTVLQSQCSLASVRPVRLGTNSFVTASNGALLGVIPAKRNRQQLTLAQISPWMAKSTIAIEDRRFWEHGALDYTGIARAALADLTSGRAVQGASTLTQQLARNLYIGHAAHTLHRKIVEACLAVRLSQRLSKRQILADYLNVVYYGNQAYGVAAAAQTYFSKRASQLSVDEAALLAGLPQAPSMDDPLRDPQAALARRNEVLRAMLVNGDLGADAYAWAVKQPLGLHPGALYRTIREPYFFGYVEQQLVAQYGERLVESGGLRVRTTIDPRLQRLAERTLLAHLPARTDPAGALVSIDPRNGQVRAMAVRVPSGERLQFNIATQGQRQAGSAFKPFTLAAALERGISLDSYWNGPPELVIPDQRCLTGVNQYWDVHNNADESAGTMNLIDATANSVNTIFAQLVTQVGPPAVVRMAHRLGIASTLKPVCSITLGTQAVDPLEMATAYATIADHGLRHDPQAVESVGTAQGKVVPFTRAKPARALSSQVADEVTYALEAVTQKGTGTAAGIGRPIAGKTGTAENFVDAWFCGYVPQLVTCVWVGYPHREEPMNYVEGYAPVYGGTIPALAWHDFMAGALWRTPVQDFVAPTIAPPTTSYYAPPSQYSVTTTGH
jgi:membrane peptidoglycan carboxypeptidase